MPRYCEVCDTDNNRHAPGCDVITSCGCGMGDCRECMKRPGARRPLPMVQAVNLR
ncbi:hypothetical protein SAMN05428985_11056 [Nocardioides sp. YR527]|nr:hypothetical protein SAMN05428985_11056 [Nocardioides sp. YR527]